MDDKLIAAVYKDSEAFKKVEQYIRGHPEDVFTDLNQVLFELASEYYSVDENAKSVDMEIILERIERKFPKQLPTLKIATNRIEETEIPSTLNIVKEFLDAKKYIVGQKLASALIQNHGIDELLNEYESLSGEESLDLSTGMEVYHAPLWTDICDELSLDNKIKLYPEDLNDRLKGGLVRGHHVLVFARPEAGKTLMAINLARGFIEQGLKVLYLGNEDPPKVMIQRMHCSLLNISEAELEAEYSKEEINELVHDAGIDRFTFIKLTPGTPNEIAFLVEKWEPDVVIVDQLRNINVKNESVVQKLEAAAREIRTIGQKYDCLMVSMTQAGDSAEGKLVLGMSDVDSSKTGIPASVDVMIGVGVDEEYRSRNKRMLSLPKNKPGNDHGFFSITVNEPVTRIL